MAHHTYPVERAENLEDAADRYRYLSVEELLWGLDLTGRETVCDVGSGTGFYTDDVATAVDQVIAIDIQPGMHQYYREKGIPDNVHPVTAGTDTLPIREDAFDAAFSTMTFHEIATDTTLGEIGRVLAEGARLVVADWTANGTGESGPPLEERYTAEYAVNALSARGFDVVFVARRPETFLLVMEHTRSSGR